VNRFWVGEDALYWNSTKPDSKEHHGRPARRIFLTDIHHVSAYVLDDVSPEAARPKSVYTIGRLRTSRFYNLHTGRIRRFKEELHFEVVYRDQYTRKETRLVLKANSRRELKFWVTGLQHLVNCASEQLLGMDIDAMSRIMFSRASWKGSGQLDLEEMTDLLWTLGIDARSGIRDSCGFLFDKFDKDGDGAIDEDEFVSIFESIMVKKVLRDHFNKYSETCCVPSRRRSRGEDVNQSLASSYDSRWPSRSAHHIGVKSSETGVKSSETDGSPHPSKAKTSGSPTTNGSKSEVASGFKDDQYVRIILPEGLSRFLAEVQNDLTASERAAAIAMEDLRAMPGAASAVAESFSGLTEIGFSLLMCSDLNMLIDPTKARLCQDMTLPLSHYWISTSHNTYLEGKQIGGKALHCWT
jgi:hypothetical protein